MRLRGVARGCRCRARRILEKSDRRIAAVGSGALGLGEIDAQPALEAGGRFAPQRQPLARTLESVERSERRLAASGRVGQLVLRLLGAPRAARSASPGHVCARSRRRRDATLHRPAARLTAARSSWAIRARNDAISRASFSARSAAVAWSARGRRRFLTSSSTSRARSTWIPTRASFSSARCLRRLNFPSPAASSTRWRRSSGFEASTASTLPCETIECIEPPRPTSASNSTRSVRRTAALLTRYWPSPPRTSRRVIAISLKSTSAPKPPSSLSKTSSTSQWSAGGCVDEPPKRTSSGFSARSSDGVNDPAAQTIASATFDLPEPFGPTTTATPGSSFSSSGSTNDLKPRILIDCRCTSEQR